MSDFKITVQSEVRYNLMDRSDESISVIITWDGGEVRAHLKTDAYSVDELRDTEWMELAELVATHVTTKYLYHHYAEKAKELLDWLADDPEDEKRIMVERAEQEHRIPIAIAAVRRALRMLGTDAQARVLAEV